MTTNGSAEATETAIKIATKPTNAFMIKGSRKTRPILVTKQGKSSLYLSLATRHLLAKP
jgi:acetylornithine/succinyldiaminopimelate/putrescine aminotransferase